MSAQVDRRFDRNDPGSKTDLGCRLDSVPELEWKETEHKARALIRAAELVEEGF